MITYKRIHYNNAAGDTGYRYLKNNLLTKEAKIPPEVHELLNSRPEVEYDDQPEKERCIFCDAPDQRRRYLNSEMIALCEWHYQNVSLGKIAAQVRLLKEEKERPNGADTTTQAKRKRKQQRSRGKDPATLNHAG